MTRLAWDQMGERRFETGVDRGVLYVPNGSAVVWNGLTSINEKLSRDIKSYYLDGIKYLDHHIPGSYEATLQAFTYPDELDALSGTAEFAPGVFLHDQRAKSFHLSYRTRIGDGIDPEYGYKLHIVYNVLAVPSDTTHSTVADTTSPVQFEWTLTGTPAQMFGIRPTSHISLDSTSIDSDLLATLEAMFYGNDDDDPMLPDLVTLMQTIEAWAPPVAT